MGEQHFKWEEQHKQRPGDGKELGTALEKWQRGWNG